MAVPRPVICLAAKDRRALAVSQGRYGLASFLESDGTVESGHCIRQL